ncbi:MAG: nitroreductase family protein [Clostridia bacterium]|nr:nitroreductase family protein [Clostridia bacterium]
MSFLELAKERYSVRSYQSKPIEREKMERILEAGRVAPTACNFQPQKIYVVTSEENRKKLAEICRFTFGAPTILVIGYDRELCWKNKRMDGHPSGETDAAIVTTHMMLAAREEGIGSCWVGVFNSEEVKAALGLPPSVTVTALMPMGYPAEDAAPAPFHSEIRPRRETIFEL